MTEYSPQDPSATGLPARAALGIFVLVWATGFLVAKQGVPYAQPMVLSMLAIAGMVVIVIGLNLLNRPQARPGALPA